MAIKLERPKFIKDEHLIFLDKLRESGITNMFGASPYVQKMFGTSKKHSIEILSYWMKTFEERHPRKKGK